MLLSTKDALFELDGELSLKKIEDPKTQSWMQQEFAPPKDAIRMESRAAVYVDERGKRWLLPWGGSVFGRVAREVATERDLLHVGSTFYELPSNNAGGIAMVRPIATDPRPVMDFASYRGLMVLSGVGAGASGERIVRSADGQAAVWVGVYDDLWKLGKPAGSGGPWWESKVKAGEPSDPYLMTGFDQKRLRLWGKGSAKVRVEVDLTGSGLWVPYRTLEVGAGKTVDYRFPDGFEAYWVRFVADRDWVGSALLEYD
jgi:hypothetical protein